MKKLSTTRSISTIFGIIAAFLIILSGCKNAQQKQEGETPSSKIPSTKEEVIKELSGYPIPTSMEITELVYKAGAPYINHLSNDPEKAGEYITQRDKALNLGVYATDLCYASTHAMKHGTMLYLEASKTLVDELGISTTFSTNYAERVESNLDDRDSVILIVAESFHDTWNYLVENQQDILARLVVCGSWIEGLYTTTNIAKNSRDNTKFLEIIAQQKRSLNELVNLMEPVKELDDVSEIFKGLFDLQDIYESVGDTLTEEQLEKVANNIEVLRGSIV
ncbi:MAG: hypothetical protein ABFS38_04870 [Bacteroidota bacterium]